MADKENKEIELKGDFMVESIISNKYHGSYIDMKLKQIDEYGNTLESLKDIDMGIDKQEAKFFSVGDKVSVVLRKKE